ncbi:MAG: hypothetical protein GY856_09805 [bacterium]|nr:hypothetical protein [bacterium]
MKMSSFLATIVSLLVPAVTLADGGEPPMCGDIPLLGTAEEISATPRENPDAELLALLMGGGLTANQAVYERVLADTDAIRALFPAVSHITSVWDVDPHSILLSVDGPTKAAILAGTYTAWDCLNDWYGFELESVFQFSDVAILGTAGVFDVPAISPQYVQLPGILWAGPNGYAGDGPTICGIQSAPTHHYFFYDGEGDCLAGCIYKSYTYFTTRPDSSPKFHGVWENDSGDPRPWWLELFELCGNGPPPGSIAVDPAAPTTGDPIVLTASGEEGNSACGPFFASQELDPDAGTIRIVANFNEECGACTPDVMPYSFDVAVGALPAGDYQVVYVSRDGCSGSERLEATAELTVRSAEAVEAGCGTSGNRAAATLPTAVLAWRSTPWSSKASVPNEPEEPGRL